MNDALEAFMHGRHVGQFTRAGHRPVAFHYDDDAPQTPLSLSLPRDGSPTQRTAENFLNNLLPDRTDVRQSWARKFGTSDTPFDLLRHMGQDVAGALVIMPEGQTPDSSSSVTLPSSDDEIAERIASIRRNPAAWLAPDQIGRVRMSLAGTQGKFTLARVGDRWFFSSAALPSTHILKPSLESLDEVPALETGTLSLARSLGLNAPQARRAEFLGQETYLIERFDRSMKTTPSDRVHTEDLAQAQGLPPERKYDPTAVTAARLIKTHAGQEDAYRFVDMLAFNTAVGNADAHAKNYSLFLESGVSLAPLYDSLPTRLWPHLNDLQAMKIGGAQRSEEIQPENWAKFARLAGLNQDRVVESARAMSAGVIERFEEAYLDAGVDRVTVDKLASLFASTNRHVRASAVAGSNPPTSGAEVWVQPHTKTNGTCVPGHWRKSPRRA